MTFAQIADGISLVLLLIGSFLCFTGALGAVRFPDLLARLHAITKPQTLGVLVVLLALALRLRSPLEIGMLLLVGIFQLITSPAAGQMMARAYYDIAGAEGTVEQREPYKENS